MNNTKKVINSRTYIIEKFEEINKRIEELNKTIDLMKSMKMNLIDYDKDKNYLKPYSQTNTRGHNLI